MDKPKSFNSLAEGINIANYVEGMLHVEYQWINNRVSWLFISQSFCITAYAIVVTSTAERFPGGHSISILNRGLPFFGIICSVMVGLAVFAARRTVRSLTKERLKVVRYINENSPVSIPLAGVEGELKKQGWVFWAGELPHLVLPWVLGAFWALQIFK
jgi:hypothetical protein